MKFEPTDRILVIGGSGFIGRHLLQRCLKESGQVTCLALHPEKISDQTGPKADILTCDISDPGSVKDAFCHRPFDYVFNLGGYIDHTPYGSGGRKVYETHFGGLLNVIDNLDRTALKAFVQVGSSDEYGHATAPQGEEIQTIPISPYSFAKQAGTSFLMMLAHRENFPAVVARLFLVYGPGQDDRRFLPQVILGCLKGDEIPVTKGEQQRDFCYVDDIVGGLVRAALTREAHGQVFNMASGTPVTIRQVMQMIVELVGSGKPCYGARPYRAGESMALVADIAKARNILKWQPETGMVEGLTRTIHFYREALSSCKS